MRFSDAGGDTLALGVNRAHLGRLLRDATGFRFKQWRWGFLLRRAVGLLAACEEQVAQIAYGLVSVVGAIRSRLPAPLAHDHKGVPVASYKQATA